jgi:hypothetical protein
MLRNLSHKLYCKMSLAKYRDVLVTSHDNVYFDAAPASGKRNDAAPTPVL